MLKKVLKYAFYFLVFVAIGVIVGFMILEKVSIEKLARFFRKDQKEISITKEILNKRSSPLTTTTIIPNLEGIDITDAKIALQEADIEIEKITWVHSDTIEKNRIIAQRPQSGTSHEGKINLLVSSGPYDVSYRCPSFIRMSLDEARRLANILGLKLIEQGDGSVIAYQKPDAGNIVKKGDSIEVTLSK